MTRLREVKLELETAKRETSTAQMALYLALTTKPNHVERLDDSTPEAYYIVSAYGLGRCDGGYIIVRFVCPGQSDSIREYLAEFWLDNKPLEFGVIAAHVRASQFRLRASRVL